MQKLVEDFTKHLKESIKIGESTLLKEFSGNIENVLLCGLGGSGIGATIIAQILSNESNLPIVVNKDYKIPAFVNKNTLVVCCSYSGNTEESLEMLAQAEEKGAEIAILTAGGQLEKIAKEKQYNFILIPSGHPPRGAFGFALPCLFSILNHYQVSSKNYDEEFQNTISTIDLEEQNIINEAKDIANSLLNKIPVIYSAANYEGVAVRFRQQLNENSKMLAWHHSIPEMNHNELVGWRTKNENLAVVILRNKDDYFRTQKRIEVNKTVFEKYTPTILEIHSKGNSQLEMSLYLVHLCDWISIFLGNKNGVNITEVDVIKHLKGELAKI
jgi:glucose/mannose-6-phosphate isomerase